MGVHLERVQKHSGESPGTSEWLWRVSWTLRDLLRPTKIPTENFHFLPPDPTTCTPKRGRFPSKARPQRTIVARKRSFEHKHLAEIWNRLHMKLVSSPNGSIFDQLPHICAEVLDAKFSLSAILLFEREVNLLLYESLWLYVYTLLTFYSVEKPFRTRILAKQETSILHENIKILFFLLSFGKCPEASRRHPRHLRMRLDCLLDPSGPPETHQSPK